MRILPMGERACLLVDLDASAHAWADAVRTADLPGVEEAVASFDTVGVYFDPERFDRSCLDALSVSATETRVPAEHTVPVWYEVGEDLVEIAERLSLSPREICALHAEPTYECRAIGFCPGFPYLASLPEALQGLPRRPEPRPRVEPGSVGLTGIQTGIYTLDRPGGWWLVGRTPLTLVDVASGFFPISVGDLVRFEPIDQAAFERLHGTRL